MVRNSTNTFNPFKSPRAEHPIAAIALIVEFGWVSSG